MKFDNITNGRLNNARNIFLSFPFVSFSTSTKLLLEIKQSKLLIWFGRRVNDDSKENIDGDLQKVLIVISEPSNVVTVTVDTLTHESIKSRSDAVGFSLKCSCEELLEAPTKVRSDI